MSMLKKKQRLTRSAFDDCFKNGRRIHSPSLTIITCRSPQFHGAVVVGKKVSKLAVQRNKIRRSLYGILYNHSHQAQAPAVWIVLVKPAAKNQSTKQLRQELQTLCQKVSQSL